MNCGHNQTYRQSTHSLDPLLGALASIYNSTWNCRRNGILDIKFSNKWNCVLLLI